MKFQYLFFILFITYVSANSSEACNPEGSHSDDWWFVPELAWWETLMGASIIFFSGLIMLPQCIKIIKNKSSKGVSPDFILLVSSNVVFGLVNSTIINYPYMESCPYVGYDVCIPALLSWGQSIMLVLIYYAVFILLFIFYEDKSSTRWKVVIGYFIGFHVFMIIALVLTALSVTVIDNCSTFSLVYAHASGVIGSILVFIQYLPQLWTTYKNKSSGSLSLTANLAPSIGFIFYILFMAFSTEQDFSAYLKYIVSLLVQGLLSCMQIYYDYILPKCGKLKEGDKEYSKLIDDEEGKN